MGFATQVRERCARLGHLCVGLDPSRDTLQSWGLSDGVEGAEAFCSAIIEACASRAAAMKPQSAYFERFGPDGLALLDRVTARIREAGCPIIIDAKRGDIGTTSAAYADAYLRPGARPDAVTVTAFLGFAALRPLLDRFADAGVCAIVVARSSNREGEALQTARLGDGRSVAEALCDEIAAWNASADEVCAGAVIGATLGAEAGRLARRLNGAPILAPGLGAQGAAPNDIATAFGSASRHVLASASRAIAAAGPATSDIAAHAVRLQGALRLS